MSRRARNTVIVGFELCLVVAMVASFAYFVLESRNFLRTDPQHAAIERSR
jgi:hypothetical protein